MLKVGSPTLDQLEVLLCVVETGSFAAAGRMLGRASSVISYTIANLESQLGLAIFDRNATRKPQLTSAGHMVLTEARLIVGAVDGLRARSRGMLEGLEAEVAIAIDVMFPTDRLTDLLTAFSERHPTVAVRLHVEGLGAISQLVLDRAAVIGITGPLNARLDALDHLDVGGVEMVPVAAPCHPLASVENPAPGLSRGHLQLVLADKSNLTAGQDFQVTAARTWRLGDLGAKHALLRAGFGWGNMPLPMVLEDLAAGRLVQLELPDVEGGCYTFRIAYRTDTPPGPAARWLIERIRSQAYPQT
jgi:DNA-binding transcriptional LysR family regulator